MMYAVTKFLICTVYSFVSSNCTIQPIPLKDISDIMDFHNIRSANYSLDVMGVPTWRDASMHVLSSEATTLSPGRRSTPSTMREKGWYLGKYLGMIVPGRSKDVPTRDFESIDLKMKRKKELLQDYYSLFASTDGFSDEFSVVSDLPLMMGWLRKRKPR